MSELSVELFDYRQKNVAVLSQQMTYPSILAYSNSEHIMPESLCLGAPFLKALSIV